MYYLAKGFYEYVADYAWEVITVFASELLESQAIEKDQVSNTFLYLKKENL